MTYSQRNHWMRGVPFYLSPSGWISGGGLRRVLFEFRSGARCVCPARASLLATRQTFSREGMSTNSGWPSFASFSWPNKKREALPGAPGQPAPVYQQTKQCPLSANHEQLKILQPLIYENGVMQGWLKMQRALENKVTGFIIPDLELVFTSDCELDMTKVKNRHSAQHAPMPKEEELVSKAPEDTVLENSKSRMKWIGKAAEQFHGLMGKYPDFMELELQTMTKWWEPV